MKAPRRNWLGIVDDISQRERIIVTDANVLINLIQVDRLDLLGALPGLGFIVPYEVESEVVVPAQSQALAGAIGAGHLRQHTFTTTKELQLYAEYVQVLGTGEAACMAMAEVHGWSIAAPSDERGKFLKLVRLRLGAQRILNTPVDSYLKIRESALRGGSTTISTHSKCADSRCRFAHSARWASMVSPTRQAWRNRNNHVHTSGTSQFGSRSHRTRRLRFGKIKAASSAFAKKLKEDPSLLIPASSLR